MRWNQHQTPKLSGNWHRLSALHAVLHGELLATRSLRPSYPAPCWSGDSLETSSDKLHLNWAARSQGYKETKKKLQVLVHRGYRRPTRLNLHLKHVRHKRFFQIHWGVGPNRPLWRALDLAPRNTEARGAQPKPPSKALRPPDEEACRSCKSFQNISIFSILSTSWRGS